MPPKKYLDFVESVPFSRVAKQQARDQNHVRNYVSITCPHCSVAFVEIPVDSLGTNKASECKKHLQSCTAAKIAGVEAPATKKRELESSEATALVLRNTQLQTEKTELLAQNQTLQSDVSTLKTQVGTLNDTIVRMEHKMDAMNHKMDHMDGTIGAIANALGFKTPPNPSREALLERVGGLVQSSKRKRSVSIHEHAHASQASLDRDDEVVELRKEAKRCKKLAKDALADAKKEVHRKLIKSVHPDKAAHTYTDTAHMARALTQKLNDWASNE